MNTFLCQILQSLRSFRMTIIVTLLFITLYFLRSSDVFAAARYPVSTLGNCRNQQECKLYCEIPQNTPACWSYNRFVLNKSVLGETDTKITFPIPELGSCANATECKAYCNRQENHTACREYAVAKGLIKPSLITQRILEAAKAELSCNNLTECKAACQRPQNSDICKSFAKKHKIVKTANAISKEIITQAKKELGCTDQASCKLLCEKPENKEKCIDFGDKHKLLKKETVKKLKEAGQDASIRFLSAKPGAPCANDKACIQYCEEHPDECPGFSQAKQALSELAPTGSGSPPAHAKFKIGDFLGPTGCLTDGECKAYCEKFPDKCPSFPKKPSAFPTIKLSIPPDRSGSNRGSGSLNSGKGSFSDLFKPTEGPEDQEDELDPTDAPDVDELKGTGSTGPTSL